MLLYEIAPLIGNQEITVVQIVDGVERTVYHKCTNPVFPPHLQQAEIVKIGTYPTEYAGIRDSALIITVL